MSKKDEEIEHKLMELESAVIRESEQHKLASTGQQPRTDFTVNSNQGDAISIQSDLCYFAGIALMLTGVLMFFHHVKIGSGLLSMFGFGGGGFGLLLIPLMLGIGWIIYDNKSKIGWTISAASGAVIFFAVLSSLLMIFPQISLLGLVMMLLPLAAGCAFFMKGLNRAQIQTSNKSIEKQ